MTKNERLNILFENLSVFQKRASLASEAREAALTHIVLELCPIDDNSTSIDALIKSYRELNTELDGKDEILLFSHAARSHRLRAQMREAFAVGYYGATEAGSHGRIACVKNNFTISALEDFSQRITNAKPNFVSSFTDACESVLDGESEFCILPIENATDGRMLGFYSMIDRYELKICHTCDVEDDVSDTVIYALLGKGCPEPSEKVKSTEFIFEFSILASDCDFMKRLISASEKCGARLLTLDCSPVQYDSRLKRYILGFSLTGDASLLLRAFLSTNYHTYTPIGLYPKHTDTKNI